MGVRVCGQRTIKQGKNENPNLTKANHLMDDSIHNKFTLRI